jgi:hypothetical protein
LRPSMMAIALITVWVAGVMLLYEELAAPP